jgi:hypothetical protein
VQPEVNLHRELGVLDRAVQIASTSELDVAADRAQRGAAAELERAVSFHGAVDRLGEGSSNTPMPRRHHHSQTQRCEADRRDKATGDRGQLRWCERRRLEAQCFSVRVVPAVLTQCPVRETRNVDGGAAVSVKPSCGLGSGLHSLIDRLPVLVLTHGQLS